MRLLVGLFVLSVFFSACCAREMVVLIPDEQGVVGKIEVFGKNGSVLLKEAWNATQVDSSGLPGKVHEMSQHQVQDIFRQALAAKSTQASEYLLYFRSGSDVVDEKSMKKLSGIVEEILNRKQYEITLIGHSDSVGNDALNLQLSKKRAKSVQRILVELGIPAEKLLSIEHYGKNVPLVPTPDGVAEPKNRRVEIFVW